MNRLMVAMAALTLAIVAGPMGAAEAASVAASCTGNAGAAGPAWYRSARQRPLPGGGRYLSVRERQRHRGRKPDLRRRDHRLLGRSILVENGGSLIAGSPSRRSAPRAACHHPPLRAGAAGGHRQRRRRAGHHLHDRRAVRHPRERLELATAQQGRPCPAASPTTSTRTSPCPTTTAGTVKGYFGYKVLALSYGGTLKLFGKKGATYGHGRPLEFRHELGAARTHSAAGDDHARARPRRGLGAGRPDRRHHHGLSPGPLRAADHRPAVGRRQDDRPVMESVELHPQRRAYRSQHAARPSQLDLTTRPRRGRRSRCCRAASASCPAGDDLRRAASRPGRAATSAATRSCARVSPPTRSRASSSTSSDRAGASAHYPVHFHMARKTPTGTFVRTRSVHDSMTRWITLHATHGVTLARNVGYLSIGHGYYLEDGTEINNQLYSNIGIFARAAVNNAPRTSAPGAGHPGLAGRYPNPITKMEILGGENVPFHSDYDHPDRVLDHERLERLRGNMAAGAGTCGACYWLVPGANSGPSRHQTWESYASMQAPSSIRARSAYAAGQRTRPRGDDPAQVVPRQLLLVGHELVQHRGNTTPCLGVGRREHRACAPAGRRQPARAQLVLAAQSGAG